MAVAGKVLEGGGGVVVVGGERVGVGVVEVLED